MRRHQRAITDDAELDSLLRSGQLIHLALLDGGGPYALTVNYGCGQGRSLYFHCAPEGRKLDILRANPQVAFSIVLGYELVRDPKPCGYTAHYCSLSGEGRAVLIEDLAERAAVMRLFMAHYGVADAEFPEAMLKSTMVVRVDITTLTGKRNPSTTS